MKKCEVLLLVKAERTAQAKLLTRKIRIEKILKKFKQNEKILDPGRIKKTLEKILDPGTLGALRFIKKITMLGTLRLIAKK